MVRIGVSTQPFAKGWVQNLPRMYYVYLLRDIHDKIYIGYSSDLKRRIQEHNRGNTYTTIRMDHPKLVYYEAYPDEISAKTREKKLKQFGSSYHGLIKRLNLIKLSSEGP